MSRASESSGSQGQAFRCCPYPDDIGSSGAGSQLSKCATRPKSILAFCDDQILHEGALIQLPVQDDWVHNDGSGDRAEEVWAGFLQGKLHLQGIMYVKIKVKSATFIMP